ncbi:hypothetical protein CSKR_103456 [Clonorchis sinensis]|uniref:Uncharacterized protein n=1 Tax=Clonorchis sinensis TaxID=79923 RepID=A0A3R7CTY6_CLOSI|nr:hypothetical protein CSKR_103456 [Clonorchis sinensis]
MLVDCGSQGYAECSSLRSSMVKARTYRPVGLDNLAISRPSCLRVSWQLGSDRVLQLSSYHLCIRKILVQATTVPCLCLFDQPARIRQMSMKQYIVDTRPPSTTEVRIEISFTQRDKAVGLDALHPTLFIVDETLVTSLTTLLRTIWYEDRTRVEWSPPTVIQVFGKRGARMSCENRHGVSRVAAISKVLSGILPRFFYRHTREGQASKCSQLFFHSTIFQSAHCMVRPPPPMVPYTLDFLLYSHRSFPGCLVRVVVAGLHKPFNC